MKSKSISILMTAFVIVMAMSFGSARLSAEVIPSTYDGINYSDGVTLDGQSGGFGWDNNWGSNASANSTITSPGLTYSQNDTLATEGNAVVLDGDTEGGTVAVYRQPTNDYASDSYWASGLLQLSSASSVNSATFNVGDISIRAAAQEGGGYNAVLRGPGTNDTFLTGLPLDEPLFLVLQLDRTTGTNGTANAWINPDVGGTSPANALGSGTMTLTSAAGAINNLILESRGTHTVDEVRIGDSFEAVSVPEPSTMVLLGLSFVLLMKRRHC